MKIIKRLGIFSFLTIIIGSCFHPPEFSVVPEISFKDAYFVITPDNAVADSLILIINFKDGDGDLGLPQDDYTFKSNPYHESNYFLEENGKLTAVATTTQDVSNNIFTILDISAGQTGKLATIRTSRKAEYSDTLHSYVPPYNRTEYVYTSIYVKKADASVLDDSFKQVKDTLGLYYVVTDTFYRLPNENNKNIEVVFDDFDWTKIAETSYTSPFNGRFPILSASSNPLQGTLRYAMYNVNLIKWFSNKSLRLKIQIKDRALHKSNIIYSDLLEF